MGQVGQAAGPPGAAQPQVEAGEAGGAGGRPSGSRGRRSGSGARTHCMGASAEAGDRSREAWLLPGAGPQEPLTRTRGGVRPRAGCRVPQVHRGHPASPTALPRRFGPPPHPAPAGPRRRWQIKLLRWGAWNRTDAGTSMRPGMRRRHWSRSPDGGWGAALRPGRQAGPLSSPVSCCEPP